MSLIAQPDVGPIERARRNMIQQQIRPWDVHDDQVLELLERVPREDFVPPALRSLAFVDTELPLIVDGVDTGENMLAPRVEARILQELRIQPHEMALEIGTGSGYLAALLAHTAHTVWSVEIDPRLQAFGAANLASGGVLNVHVEGGDGARGWAAHAPYDVIVVSGSVPEIPAQMLEQLKPGGRLAAIVGIAPVMQLQVVTRGADGRCTTVPLFETCTKPLHGCMEPTRFRF